jgi:hypothetical protein
MTEKSAPAHDANQRQHSSVTFENPVRRGETLIESITLRKPRAGELRGLSLQALGQSDVNQLIALIPRISEPPLTLQEVEAMEIEDIGAIGSVVFDFFLGTEQREMIETILGH